MTIVEQIHLTCIRCPRGCQLDVEVEEGEVLSVAGNACKRGETYAQAEATNPLRVVTSSVPVTGSKLARMVSVKTADDVPKAKVRAVVESLCGITVEAPIAIGDVIVRNAAGTGVDLVATRRA